MALLRIWTFAQKWVKVKTDKIVIHRNKQKYPKNTENTLLRAFIPLGGCRVFSTLQSAFNSNK